MSREDEHRYCESIRQSASFGRFIEIHPADEDLAKKYAIPPESITPPAHQYFREHPLRRWIKRALGRHRSLIYTIGKNRYFRRYMARVRDDRIPYVHQCTYQYYADLIRYLAKQRGEIKHLCEVGVFLGGASVLLAQAAVDFDLTLDLIDLNPNYLGYTYELILRYIPEAADRVRAFHGDFPTYVESGHLPRQEKGVFIQFDASHEFRFVLKDMVALRSAKEFIKSFAIQDTNLRSKDPENEIFVDLAVYAMFGFDVRYRPIGYTWSRDIWIGSDWQLYLAKDRPEGFLIELAENRFGYPSDEV